jgi:hypothetical protein
VNYQSVQRLVPSPSPMSFGKRLLGVAWPCFVSSPMPAHLAPQYHISNHKVSPTFPRLIRYRKYHRNVGTFPPSTFSSSLLLFSLSQSSTVELLPSFLLVRLLLPVSGASHQRRIEHHHLIANDSTAPPPIFIILARSAD